MVSLLHLCHVRNYSLERLSGPEDTDWGTLMLTHWTAPVICETDETDEIIPGIINTMMLR